MPLQSPEYYLDAALEALRQNAAPHAVLDGIPVPVYLTDSAGRVTYWNKACVEFAGRIPQLGEDRWCVTWQLYTMTGDRLPHDQCPMAEAIRHRKPVRNAVAIAERPDGSRAAFTPYPTPLFDKDGELTGAVNLLIDVTAEQAEVLDDQASRCRRLARATHDRDTSELLAKMAIEYERTAAQLQAGS